MVLAATGPVSLESSMVRLKKLVYKNRVRIKDFLVDFDKLRTGFVHPNHFQTALSMAGVDKVLTAVEISAITDAYTTQRTPSLALTDYRSFLSELDGIFTVAELEKTPLTEVPAEPSELLDKTRYRRPSRQLTEEREAILQGALTRLADTVAKRGTPVKAFFDDAAADDHSAKLYGHVTMAQMRQCLSTKLDLPVTEAEAEVIQEKFANEDKPDLVNFVAFSNVIDPVDRYYTM